MKTHILSCSCIIIIALLLPQLSRAQDSTAINRFWFSSGLGVGQADGELDASSMNGFFAGSLNGSYQNGANLFSTRSAIVSSGCFLQPCDHEVFWDVALLYGRSTTQKWAQASIALGPAVTGRVEEHDSHPPEAEFEEWTTIGLAGEVQLFLRIPIIGVGLYGFANLNDRESFYGLTLNLQVWGPRAHNGG